MITKEQREELKELVEEKRDRELEIYYPSDFLAKEYLALHKKFVELKFRMNSLEH